MKRPLLAIIGIILAIIVVIGWKFIFPKKKVDNGPKPEGLTEASIAIVLMNR